MKKCTLSHFTHLKHDCIFWNMDSFQEKYLVKKADNMVTHVQSRRLYYNDYNCYLSVAKVEKPTKRQSQILF